jgi:hypothetical protein
MLVYNRLAGNLATSVSQEQVSALAQDDPATCLGFNDHKKLF